ncbi:MAG: NAD(P)H-dependent oxidoreductase [Kofleriaceae bacterium]
MNVLIVFAHPEPKSLSSALRDVAVAELEARGHTVRVSDLYAMKWKAQIDREDFPALEGRLLIPRASGDAFHANVLTDDVRAEQDKLRWADCVILQFPMWWYSMPAILKGWVDRVFSYGLAYGVGAHDDVHYGDRYGEGSFAGKRAMLIVTCGGRAPHFGPRGINGPIDDLLFPINHGILHYPGFTVLPSFVTYSSDHVGAAGFQTIAEALRARMRDLATCAPIPYRTQNAGDYAIPSCELHPGKEPPGTTGFALHFMKTA